LGIDPTKQTFRHNAIDRRLTDVLGQVIRELMAWSVGGAEHGGVGVVKHL
jgi:hypothetical protein